VASVEAAIESTKESIQSYRDRMQDMRTNMEATNTRHQEVVKQKQYALAKVQEAVSQQMQEAETLKKQVDDFKSEILSLKAQISQLEVDEALRQQELEDETDKCRTLLTDNLMLNPKIQEKKDFISELQLQINKTTSTHQSEIRDKIGEINDLRLSNTQIVSRIQCEKVWKCIGQVCLSLILVYTLTHLLT